MMNKYYDINNLFDENGDPITITFENKYIMKINKILNNINTKYEDYYVQDIVSGDDLKLLLDYIIKIREYYNDIVNKYEDLIEKYSNILDENQQLKKQKDELEKENNELQKAYELIDKSMYELMKQKDDVVEYIKEHKHLNWYVESCYTDNLLRMLGEIDENR